MRQELTYAPGAASQRSGLRSRGLFGALGLRPAIALHTPAEGAMLRHYAEGARCLVEIGVAEGTSAWELRHAADPAGSLYLIDPYLPGRIPGLNMARIVARRLLGGQDGVRPVWIQDFSHEASLGWDDSIDFLLIDGDHSYEGVSRDWQDWSPHVRPGGIVALHDARVFDSGWVEPSDGPVRLRESIERGGAPGWEVMDGVDSLAIVRRAKGPV